MHVTSSRLAVPSVLVCLSLAVFAEERLEHPDLSGAWKLDEASSDDIEAKFLERDDDQTDPREKNTRPHQEQLDRLSSIARGLKHIEIKQTPDEFTIADEDGNLRIYYADGEEHHRETKWGESLQVVSKWIEDEFVVRTRGDSTGEVHEIYALQGRQLAYIIRVETEAFADEVIARHYYDREDP